MVETPAVIPFTVPLTTVASVLLLLQTPPLVASVSTVLLPTHTTELVGLIAAGELVTVTKRTV